jgi:adenine/guanine phosphoribosyltransferase-like PRPP-binding protein
MTDSLHFGVDCLEHAFDPPAKMAARASATIPRSTQFDTIIGCGMSGALVVPLLANELGKKYAIVRKPEDRHKHKKGHGEDVFNEWSTIEGELGHTWIFVDDGMASGATMAHTQARVADVCQRSSWQAEQVGGYFYGRDRWMTLQEIADHLAMVFAQIWS